MLSPQEISGVGKELLRKLDHFNGLKVHKIKNFFGSEFEFYTISLLDMRKKVL